MKKNEKKLMLFGSVLSGVFGIPFLKTVLPSSLNALALSVAHEKSNPDLTSDSQKKQGHKIDLSRSDVDDGILKLAQSQTLNLTEKNSDWRNAVNLDEGYRNKLATLSAPSDCPEKQRQSDLAHRPSPATKGSSYD
nr:hypothetical protein [Parapedobacter soli]